MNNFSIKKNDVHIWRVFLPSFISQITTFQKILSAEELERSQRFKFEKHRNRFIIARTLLRNILSLYTEISPESILFSYGPHGKPYLDLHSISFNVSHSHDMAVYALTHNKNIGIDIEKIETFNPKIAKRFFNKEEYRHLISLPVLQRNKMFYTIWSRKEALVKALGKGLSASLADFSSLSEQRLPNTVIVNDQTGKYRFHVINFEVDPDYETAFAVALPLTDIYFWEWQEHGPVAWR